MRTEDLLEAYYDCCNRKRHSGSYVRFTLDRERELVDLRDAVNEREYKPSTSVCFVVSRPRWREVFAADFRDRVLHHWVRLRVEPLFEQTFSDRCFNCRKGKGVLYGVKMLQKDIEEESEMYHRECYVATIDIKGFFMSINKEKLWRMLSEYLNARYEGEDKEDLLYVCEVLVRHCPEKNCERHSPVEFWDNLSSDKSLFTCGEGRGLAIGNLFSQLFANFFLDRVDKEIEGMGLRFGRYADDIYLVSADKKKILSAVPKIRTALESLGLRMHPRKFYIQEAHKGVSFAGGIVMPGRVYCEGRVREKLMFSVDRLNGFRTLRELAKRVESVNSLLGLMRNFDEYGFRRKVLERMSARVWKRCFVKGRFESVRVKKSFRMSEKVIKRVWNERK